MSRLIALLLALACLSACGGGGSSTTSRGNSSDTGSSGTGSGGTGSTSTSCAAITTGVGASLGGFVPFPTTNAWNQDISTASVDPNSGTIINAIGSSTAVHADFGAGLYNGGKIGIPYVIVDGTQPLVPITFTAYGSESDPGPMPIPATGPDRGRPSARHWRSPRAGVEQRKLFSLRAVQLLSGNQRQLVRRLRRRLGHDRNFSTSLLVDVSRRRRTTHLPGPRAL